LQAVELFYQVRPVKTNINRNPNEMVAKFKNKYRIESARLAGYDYSQSGAYFITICTRNRQHYFGEILPPIGETGVTLHLTPIGQIAEQEWIKTPAIRPDMNISLNAYMVMPNHFHGIIIFGENEFNRCRCRGAMHRASTPIDAMHHDPTPIDATHHNLTPITGGKFGPQSKNLASVIRGFKSAVTVYARKNNIEFGWQGRFHDHIIRNEDEFHRIRNYILANPANWFADKFYHNHPDDMNSQ